MERTDTAHLHWGRQWATEAGRAHWLEPDPGVRACAERLRQAGAGRALDLGCGVGRHALLFAELGFETDALDGAPEGLAVLRETAAARGLVVNAVQGLMTGLPFEDGRFDYVLAFNVIYHGSPGIVAQSLSEIWRVLKPGGTYQGTMLSWRHMHRGQGREVAPATWVNPGVSDRDHPHFYCDAASLVALLRGFELLELRDQPHSSPGSWHWHLIAERLA